MKEIDFEELEKEIDRAIDTLFVTKEEAGKGEPKPPPQTRMEESRPPRGEGEELQRRLEGIEVELLTLEWEFKPEGIRRVLGLLQELRGLDLPEGMDTAVELLQKTLHRFMADDSAVTPEGVKFIQDLWQFLKGVAEGKGYSRERLEDFESHYRRLFEERVPVVEKAEEERPPALAPHELLRAWEGLEQVLGEAVAKLQELKRKVGEERRLLLGRVLAPGQRMTMFIFRVGEELFASDPARVLKVVPLSQELARTFLQRGAVRLRDGTIPLYRMGGEGYQVGRSPVVVILRGEGGLKGVIADEALGRGEVAISAPGRGRWKGREIQLIM